MTTDRIATEPVADRYRRLADAFAAKVTAVDPARWDDPSPCEGWSARDVVRHVVDTNGMFLGFVGAAPGDVPAVDDDPHAAFDAARRAVQAHLDDPALAAVEFDGLSGRSTIAEAVDRFLCLDLVVHGWDLARATGLDERIDPGDMARVRADLDVLGEGIRTPGVCGPAVETAPDADEQTRFLAHLGRQA